MAKLYRILLEMPLGVVGPVLADIQERHKGVHLVEGGPVANVQGDTAADPMLNYLAHHVGEDVTSAALREIHVKSGRAHSTANNTVAGLVRAGFLVRKGRGRFLIRDPNSKKKQRRIAK